MSGNVKKSFCRGRQQDRPSSSFLRSSCPSKSYFPSCGASFSSSSHGNSLSAKERKPHNVVHSSCRKPVYKKQCLKDCHSKRPLLKTIKSCGSIDSIHINVRDKYLSKHNTEENKHFSRLSISKKKFRSLPLLDTVCLNERKCVIGSLLDFSTNNDLKSDKFVPSAKEQNNANSIDISDKNLKRSIVRGGGCDDNNEYVKQTNCSENIPIKSKVNNASSKVVFPNSLLLFPFPTTPVEKCFSPKTPCPTPLTPLAWNNREHTEPPATDTKKTRGSRFEFGANFIRRFSLTQLTS